MSEGATSGAADLESVPAPEFFWPPLGPVYRRYLISYGLLFCGMIVLPVLSVIGLVKFVIFLGLMPARGFAVSRADEPLAAAILLGCSMLVGVLLAALNGWALGRRQKTALKQVTLP